MVAAIQAPSPGDLTEQPPTEFTLITFASQKLCFLLPLWEEQLPRVLWWCRCSGQWGNGQPQRAAGLWAGFICCRAGCAACASVRAQNKVLLLCSSVLGSLGATQGFLPSLISLRGEMETPDKQRGNKRVLCPVCMQSFESWGATGWSSSSFPTQPIPWFWIPWNEHTHKRIYTQPVPAGTEARLLPQVLLGLGGSSCFSIRILFSIINEKTDWIYLWSAACSV